jgi:hypothetical protein
MKTPAHDRVATFEAQSEIANLREEQQSLAFRLEEIRAQTLGIKTLMLQIWDIEERISFLERQPNRN